MDSISDFDIFKKLSDRNESSFNVISRLRTETSKTNFCNQNRGERTTAYINKTKRFDYSQNKN